MLRRCWLELPTGLDRCEDLLMEESVTKLVLGIDHSQWECPHCGEIPEGTNFKVRLTDTTVGMSLVDWVDGKREVSLVNFGGPEPKSFDDLVVKKIVFEGCFRCLNADLAKTPLGTVMFKALWNVIKGQRKSVGGRQLMPNIGHGRCFVVGVT